MKMYQPEDPSMERGSCHGRARYFDLRDLPRMSLRCPVTKNIVTGHRSDIAMKVGDQVSSRGVAPKPPGFSTHAADSQIFYTHDRTVRKKK